MTHAVRFVAVAVLVVLGGQSVYNGASGAGKTASRIEEDPLMQYMLVYSLKDTASPSEVAALTRKFQSWQPPDGITMEGNWSNGYSGGYALFRTDDYTLVGEVASQYSGVFSFTVDPVTPVENMVPAQLRGTDWAVS
jgi:hypothetical protein